ncbi:hypothetical protein G6F56_010070 [Rhizopus delemar]|nr:hypothetical protein G6F56_010070 [Rhizopus delemar]
MHFRQLAFLAGKIGRTIVLPNVQHSHIGACLAYPFSFYYNEKTWLKSTRKHFDSITMQDFQAWLEERKKAGTQPTGQEIYIQGSQKSKLLYKKKNCFQNSFDFTDRPIANYQLADISHPSKKDGNVTQIMMSLLSDEAREHEHLGTQNTPVDVINLYYDRRFKFIEGATAQRPIPYSPHLVKTADKISHQLEPYVAIHWRMERLEPTTNLVPCAHDLVEKVKRLGISNVFLLTDYPHLLNTPGAKPESSSFHPNQLKAAHHRAIRYVYQQLNVTLTAASDPSLPNLPWQLVPVNTENDQSVLGIIDKLVALKAQYFLAGEPGVCAKSSSFTGGISLYRSNAAKQGDKNIIVPLEIFDLPKQML